MFNDPRETDCRPVTRPPQLFVERTLAIVKPDAVDKAKEIEDIIIRAGFTIVQRRRVQLSPEEASTLYAEHFGKLFYPSLVSYMSSGPSVIFVLARVNAISYWRDMIGPTNAIKARETHPDSLRAIYGTDNQKNGLHGSANYLHAEREIRFFFHDSVLEPIITGMAAEDYLAKYINPTLLRGLTELCKKKPMDPVIWLADWFLDNNPFKARIRQEPSTLNDEESL